MPKLEGMHYLPLRQVFAVQDIDVMTRDAAGVIVDGEIFLGREHLRCLQSYLSRHKGATLTSIHDLPRAGFHVIGSSFIFGSLPFFTNMAPADIYLTLRRFRPEADIYFYRSRDYAVARITDDMVRP